jgi:hypothetical protein
VNAETFREQQFREVETDEAGRAGDKDFSHEGCLLLRLFFSGLSQFTGWRKGAFGKTVLRKMFRARNKWRRGVVVKCFARETFRRFARARECGRRGQG